MNVENLLFESIKIGIITATIDGLPAHHPLLEERLPQLLELRRNALDER